MCGIAGVITKKEIQKESIYKTLDLMNNRGPDYQDYIKINFNKNNLYLLHSRLSIIDLDKRANQPFAIENLTIVFNGEIYNYLEIKKDLQKKGYNFKTNSDTEVLLTSYIEYGEKCVEFFEGMWAFAIYDSVKKIVFLSRDIFGEKPLFIHEDGENIYFASEVTFIKSLSSSKFSLNTNHFFKSAVHGYRSLNKTNETYFTKIFKVSNATNVIIDFNLKTNYYRYWKINNKINKKLNIQDAINQTREIILKNLEKKLRSDVPLAFCLSGGIDSGSLASITSKIYNKEITTFSIIDSDEKYDEEININLVVKDLKCKNNKIILDKSNNIFLLKDLIKYHNSPVATISYLVHSYLLKEMSKKGFKVSISGTGGDELFSGYYDHFIYHLHENKNNKNFKMYFNEWQKYIEPTVRNPFFKKYESAISNDDKKNMYYNADNDEFYTKKFKSSFDEENYSNDSLRNRMMNELFHEVVPIALNEDDLNSMMYSIENRSPLLDKDLFEFVNTIPTEFLIQYGYGKYILRMAMKNILIDDVRLCRKKNGFNASFNTLFDTNSDEIKDEFNSDSPVYDYVNKKKIFELLNKNNLTGEESKFLFNILNINIFNNQQRIN